MTRMFVGLAMAGLRGRSGDQEIRRLGDRMHWRLDFRILHFLIS
jgi:hypothetical protein